MSDDIEELLRAAEAAEAAALATLPTAEEERVIIDAAEALAGVSSCVQRTMCLQHSGAVP